ncbi:MAG: LysR family transcriptional regulator [Alphaproteobacteria bacterium]
MENLPKTFYYKRNLLQILRGFFFTVQFKSISNAAAQMGLTQSTVSLQIQALERDLGVKLFHRHGPRIDLTEEGKSFYTLALPYVEGIDSLYEKFHIASRDKNKRTLDICTSQVSMLSILPRYMEQYKKENPDVTITIRNTRVEEAFSLLLKNKTDVALFPKPLAYPEEFVFESIIESPYILVVRAGHPLSQKKLVNFKDLTEYDLVRSDPEFVSVPLFEETIKRYNLNNQVNFKMMADWEVHKRFIRYSDCFCFFPDIGLDEHDKTIVGLQIEQYLPPVTYGLFIKKGRILQPQVETFLDATKKCLIRKK